MDGSASVVLSARSCGLLRWASSVSSSAGRSVLVLRSEWLLRCGLRSDRVGRSWSAVGSTRSVWLRDCAFRLSAATGLSAVAGCSVCPWRSTPLRDGGLRSSAESVAALSIAAELGAAA